MRCSGLHRPRSPQTQRRGLLPAKKEQTCPLRVRRTNPSTWSKMGSQVSMEAGTVHVVIVGGGFGGIAAASQLQALNIPFVLVDMKDSFHHNVAALRASVERGFAKKTFISYSVTFKENFRQGLVVEIDLKNQTVLLEDGEVTLIHSQMALADTELLPCVRQEVKEILLRKGVQLLLSERVSNLEGLPLNEYQECIKVQTDKGTEVAANLVIVCNGIRINTLAYRSALGDRLAGSGALRVNEHLQVEGCSHIYAIGDCANVREPKMAYHAGLHASVAVANIVNSVKQRPLKTYKPGSLTFLLAMGRNDGVGQISGFYVGRLMVRLAKSRDLLVSTSWKTMRQSPP
ncbi:apoptosis-inducing factor 2 isoform X5 [Sus scrofa]|uniref:apoptosis-inducing factor 2 isoform X5 n=1 Tax=Sus scrofa TaxID=9823 RepID=UPI000A2B7633|nr:apoptosis-inducing factor 2 isoform X5 [Sus scrofa]XP_020929522.1 apoptosis-inducing factor 2 isoform X5 [Sus scrofa]